MFSFEMERGSGKATNLFVEYNLLPTLSLSGNGMWGSSSVELGPRIPVHLSIKIIIIPHCIPF